jgi:thiamine-monophosphate kinase
LLHALRNGEDFELLFAVSPGDGARLLASPDLGVELTHIGEVIVGNESFLRDSHGSLQPLPCGGWEHPLD